MGLHIRCLPFEKEQAKILIGIVVCAHTPDACLILKQEKYVLLIY